jgi:replicative DNA helicase
MDGANDCGPRSAEGGARAAPHNLHAEAAVLAAILFDLRPVDPVLELLQPETFYSRTNQYIYEAVTRLHAKGELPDVVAVEEELRRGGKPVGTSYLGSLMELVPAVAPIETYARIVREKWCLRQVIATCEHIAAEGYNSVGAPQVENARHLLGEIADPTQARQPTITERALTLGLRGVRIPLGIDLLDRACRGGPLAGRLLIFGGEPGASKTTWVTQIALNLAARSVAVAILAADEDADAVLIRIGQNGRLCREALEAGDESACAALAEGLTGMPLLLFDGGEGGVTIEAASAALTRLAAGRPSVLIVDSIQTASTMGAANALSPRDRADVVVRALKRSARRAGHLVVATSETARGWYRDRSRRIDPLAAFKESGGIEYAAALALVMTTVKGDDDLVDVTVVKNRMGQKCSFRLRRCVARARLEEVPPEADVVEGAVDNEARAERMEKVRQRILRTVRCTTTLTSKSAVSDCAGGNRADNMKAFNALQREGLIVKEEGAFRASSVSSVCGDDVARFPSGRASRPAKTRAP